MTDYERECLNELDRLDRLAEEREARMDASRDDFLTSARARLPEFGTEIVDTMATVTATGDALIAALWAEWKDRPESPIGQAVNAVMEKAANDYAEIVEDRRK